MPYPVFVSIQSRPAKRVLAWLVVLIPLLSTWVQDGGSAALPSGSALSMPEAIRRTLDEESRSLTSLHARLEDVSNDAEALAIERELEQKKSETELALLRIQAQEARDEGRVALAEEIERAIDDLLHPRIPLAPSAPSQVESGSNSH